MGSLLRFVWGLIPSLAGALGIAFFSWFAGKWAKRLVERNTQRLKWDEILWGYVGTALRYLVVIVGFITALKHIGYTYAVIHSHALHFADGCGLGTPPASSTSPGI